MAAGSSPGTDHPSRAWHWLVTEWNWPAAGLVVSGVLLALTPGFWWLGGWPMLLVAAQLPVYMIHQAEEHLRDRFRLDINVMAGCEALSRTAVFWINIVGVWALGVLSLLLMITVSPAWGLLAAWIMLINGFVHVLAALVRRQVNPGLVTAVLLFLPLGGATLQSLRDQIAASPDVNTACLAIVVAVHAGIVAWVALRRHQILSVRGGHVADPARLPGGDPRH
jgi:hypothetical protein